ncbi:MAG: GTPase [Planctomycetota bacterium]
MIAHGLSYRVETARGTGAIAIIALRGESEQLDAWLARNGLPACKVGDARHADLLGIDDGVLARPSATCLQLMPHGGLAILERLEEALRSTNARAGTERERPSIESRMHSALARATSPLAIDAILKQQAIHAKWDGVVTDGLRAHARVLNRLLDPPLVACAGPTNVGKSTLLNTLARREASLVADESGTTRDHVGVMLELDGLVVRWADLPGLMDDAVQGAADRASWSVAQRVLSRADLVIWCDDASGAPGSRLDHSSVPRRPDIFVRTRTDLTGLSADSNGEHALALPPDGPERGLSELAAAIREALVPRSVLGADLPWLFDG